MQRTSLTVSLVLFFAVLHESCIAESWTEFRGPTGQGQSSATQVPLQWDADNNIRWKTKVPGTGWSSPVIADGKIWLTSALDNGSSLFALCYSLDTGDEVLRVPVFEDNKPKKIHHKNSHASPTPLLENGRVYVHFGTYGTACLKSDGEVLWRQKLDYEPLHGPGGSPVLFNDLLIVNCDGSDVQYVIALNKRTGKVVWKTPRKHASPERLNGEKMVPIAFSTPLVVTRNGTSQVISAGGDHVAAYDASTGKEVWWLGYDGYSVVPRPVVAHDIVFVSSCYDGPIFYAIKLGGQGNVTKSHVQWTMNRGAPHNPSPVVVGDEVYTVNDGGIATCLDVRSGEKHWQKRLGGAFSASPIAADGRVYFTSEDGATTVIRAGKKYHALAKNEMNERMLASLAPIDGGIVLRTETHLVRIGQQE